MESGGELAPLRAFAVYVISAGGWPRCRLESIRSTPERARDDAAALYRRHGLLVVAEHSEEDARLGRMLGLPSSWRNSGAVVGEG